MHDLPFQIKVYRPIKSVNNFSLNQNHVTHQTSTYHIKRCVVKVHGQFHYQSLQPSQENPSKKNLAEKLFENRVS